MILDIVKYPDKRLLEKSRIVWPEEYDTPFINDLIRDMKETMLHTRAVGLSAPQVGHNLRIITIDFNAINETKNFSEDLVHAYLNPMVEVEDSERIRYNEGCLSFPGVGLSIERAGNISLNYVNAHNWTNEFSYFSCFAAVVIQHEIDHLDGKLFIDRVSRLKRDRLIKKLNKKF